ncbi:DUF6282 family protein [Phytohabitans sp. ZYX-F-186]|uniref:DUF6282 family protein n=1 Tax=Phytohabitans maris TaxID=3071409 RepID=A0ABU0ZT44_9ACTN|nr:DUF6282 family protein [Phytohabitans sp. ZYX-F-186]MDQ7910150.1 DUF6282 family protein [Phytohabitans sp. ZYX-F-186]
MTVPSAIHKVLHGLVDLHCHSGPNPFPRRFDHAEAARDGERLQMRAILVKSHHHNTVMDLLAMGDRLRAARTEVFGGIALNNQVGGVNPFAVELSLRMGGKAVWFPTVSSAQHIAYHHAGGGFPKSTVELSTELVEILGADGELVPAARRVLDLVKESGALVTGGHMDAERILRLFTEARARGVERMLVSHPNFVVGADHARCLELVRLGAYVEHETSMYDPEVRNVRWGPEVLLEWIERIGPEHTVLASDLGQDGRPLPADSFARVGAALLDLGLPEKDLRRMVRTNPAYLLGLDDD